jgi:hypothetical protein
MYTECVQVGEIFLGTMRFGRTAHILHKKLNGLFSEVRTWSVQCVVSIWSNR